MQIKKFILQARCPAAALAAQLFIGFFLFFKFIEANNLSQNAIGNDKIRTKLTELAQECGSDHYWTWIVINEKEKNFYFQDVVGCNPALEKNCGFSVKYTNLNPMYSQVHKFQDTESLEFLNRLDTGMAAYFDDMQYFKKYSTISSFLERTNKKIQSIGLTVTKDYRRNLVYLFLKTSSRKNPTSCDKNQTTQLLEDLSIYARGNL